MLFCFAILMEKILSILYQYTQILSILLYTVIAVMEISDFSGFDY